jgi:hypothetical protein
MAVPEGAYTNVSRIEIVGVPVSRLAVISHEASEDLCD